MPRSFASLALALGCSVLAVVACSKDEEKKKGPLAELGEPVGADVPAKGNVPAISLAFAVTKGQDPVPFLPQIVGAVAGAVASCPAFASEAADSVTAVNFTVERGKTKVVSRPEATPGATCLSASLDGKDLGAGALAVRSARVEIKVSPMAAKVP